MHGNFVVVAVPIRPIPRCATDALGQLWRKRDGVDPHFKGSRCSPDQRHANELTDSRGLSVCPAQPAASSVNTMNGTTRWCAYDVA